MKLARFGWIAIFLVSTLLSTGLACSFSPGYEAPQVLPPPPPPTPEICSEETPGLSIQLLFGRLDEDGQRVTVNGVGFVPGERIKLRVSVEGVSTSVTSETLDQIIEQDGTFSSLDVLPVDEPDMRWEVRAIHQRGIACLRTAKPK